MLKKHFDATKKILTFAKQKIPISSVEALISEIDEHINALADKSKSVFDNPFGHINYYSPQVKQQYDKTREALQHYRRQIITLRAVAVLYHNTKKRLADLNLKTSLTPAEKEEIQNLQRALDTYRHSKDLSHLAIRKDVKEMRNSIKKDIKYIENIEDNITNISKEIKRAKKKHGENSSEYISYVKKLKELQEKLKSLQKKYQDVPAFSVLSNRVDSLTTSLTKHEKITAQLPQGMRDVKRALVLLNQKKHDNTIKFSTSDGEDKEIVRRLTELQSLMQAIRIDYQKIATSGGDLNELLYKTTEHYWQNIHIFNVTLRSFDTYLKKHGKHLSDSGNFIAKCIKKAKSNLPNSSDISDSLEQLDSYKDDEDGMEDFLDDKKIRFYSKDAIKFLTSLSKKNSGPVFHIPYRKSLYVLDFPAGTDYAGTLGNCFGESMMFLKQISRTKPSINNICPETDLLNMQLDQSRQLSTKSTVKTLAKSKDKNTKVVWNDLKAAIVSPAKSNTGDLCLIKLGGGRLSGEEGNIGHAIALIKIKNPSPYKYMLYEHGFGAMGFSSEKQLEQYFTKVLDGFITFKKFTLEKHGNLTQQGLALIQGIPPVNMKKKTGKVPEQTQESLDRLLPLARYGQSTEYGGIKLVIERAKYLNKNDALQVYQALLENAHLTTLEKLKLGVKAKNHTFNQLILQSADFQKALTNADYEEVESNFKLFRRMNHNEQWMIYTTLLKSNEVDLEDLAELCVSKNNPEFFKFIIADKAFETNMLEAYSGKTILDKAISKKNLSIVTSILTSNKYDNVEDILNRKEVKDLVKMLDENLVVSLIESGKLQFSSMSKKQQKNEKYIRANQQRVKASLWNVVSTKNKFKQIKAELQKYKKSEDKSCQKETNAEHSQVRL